MPRHVIRGVMQLACVIASGYLLGDTTLHQLGITLALWALMPVAKP